MEDYNTTQHEVSLEDLKMDAHMVGALICRQSTYVAASMYVAVPNVMGTL